MKTPEFACGTSAYLNNASVSPMPVESIKAVSEFLTKYSQMGPDSAESEPFVTETLPWHKHDYTDSGKVDNRTKNYKIMIV